MSIESANAFLDRLETDDEFRSQIEALGQDTEAVRAFAAAQGYDATPDEAREALLDRYGDELSPEMLESISAGVDSTTAIAVGASLGAVATVAVFAALWAAVAI